MANKALTKAKNAKKDEFYTQLPEIQAEVNAYLDYDPDVFRGKTVLLPCDDPEWSNFTRFFAQNFERFGLKKLISTSYAPESKSRKYGALFTYAAERSEVTPQNERGKIFVLDHDTNANGRIDFDDLEWGELYERYHSCAYNADAVWKRVEELYEDDCVTAKKGIFEYILGGEKDTKLLNVRVFSKKDAKTVYAKQTAAAQKKGVSNCPLCAAGHEANKTKIWPFDEMDADHVKAWSKGGATDIRNCQMLCKTHNRAKGNR